MHIYFYIERDVVDLDAAHPLGCVMSPDTNRHTREESMDQLICIFGAVLLTLAPAFNSIDRPTPDCYRYRYQRHCNPK